MNRFRVNLHPALFEIDELPRQQPEKYPERQDIDQTKNEVVENPAFSNIAGTVASNISSRYAENYEQLTKNRKRFTERLKSNDSSWTEYNKVWENKISGGFNHLMKALEENNYFKDCKSDADKTNKKAEVLVKYLKEVRSQYENNIWVAGDKTFNNIKDTIFWENSKDYPANKVYCELTWAATIFNTDTHHMEWYGMTILESWGNSTETSTEAMSEKQNRKFLSNDLPQYLWNIKKTPWILKAFNWLPIFKVKESRPSKTDRKAIDNFLKTASRLQTQDKQDKAVALLNIFKESRGNFGMEQYKALLSKHQITVEDKYLDDIVSVGKFYLDTQRDANNPENQHAIYLSVLKIIETEWWADNAATKFKPFIEQEKQNNKVEKKEWYANGKKLQETNPELYNIAKQLGITDFTSATRLSEKTENYFKQNNIGTILANLDNDNTLSARDTMTWWLKTWQQFLEIFNQVWENTALSNLADRVNLESQVLWITLPKYDKDTIKVDIKNWHTWLILLLQNIINNPGEDLLTLLWDKKKPEYNKEQLANAKKQAEKMAGDMAKNIDLSWLKEAWLTGLPQPEELQSWLAATLYSEYTKGLGFWSKISFDEWVKWLAMNTGFQVRDDGSVVVWIWLSYNKEINLWKWWSTTPMFSAWGFIPLWYWKPELGGSLWFSDEIAKKWITYKWVAQKIWLDAGVTMVNGAVVLSAGLSWYRDKLAWIDVAEHEKREEMAELVKSMLDEYIEESKKAVVPAQPRSIVLKLTDNDTMRKIIEQNAKKTGVPTEKIDTVVKATMKLLAPYEGATLSPSFQWFKEIIAEWVADQYAMAWAEDRKAHISDSTYLSGANLWAFWVAGAPLVWIYAGIRLTDHDLDWYGDRWWNEYELNNANSEWWTDKTIDLLNQRLGLSKNEALSVNEEGIQIPNSLTAKMKVSEDMKWLMKKDQNWNVTLSKRTTLRESIMQWTAIQSKELYVWAWPDFKTKLNTANDDWFTNDMNKVNDGVVEKVNELLYTPEAIKWAIAQLKDQAQWQLDAYNPTDDEINKIVNDLKTKAEKNPNHKLRLVIEKNADWISSHIEDTNNEWRWLELQYTTKLEMFDSKAKQLADKVYERAAKLDNPGALNKIKHPVGKEMQAYKDFVAKLNGKNYEWAKSELIKVITKLNESYTWEKAFPTPAEWPTGEALGQLLMSINNVFARSTRVKWKGNVESLNQYEFTTQMWSIVEERERQIGSTLDKKLSPQDAAIYKKLIAATKKYREQNNAELNHTSAQAAHLNNTVWFNLWDQTNPENPLLNPEIYQYGMMDSAKLEECGFSLEEQNALHTRAINNFITNNALFNPLKRVLWLDESATVKIAEWAELNNWKIKLDIWWKKVTLSSEMKFWYFTQCVNHTVILDNISLEDENGNTMNFGSGTWESGKYVEWNKSSIVATTTYNFGIAFTARWGNEMKDANTRIETWNSTVTDNGSTTTTTSWSTWNYTGWGTGSNNGGWR